MFIHSKKYVKSICISCVYVFPNGFYMVILTIEKVKSLHILQKGFGAIQPDFQLVFPVTF